MKCPFSAEFGKWIECSHYERDNDGQCRGSGPDHKDISAGRGGSWCAKMISRAMLAHKTWIGNDY